MRTIIEFLKTTLIGGLLVVLPIWVIIILVIKSLTMLAGFIKPLVDHLPGSVNYPWIVAIAILLAACFAVGIAVRTALGRWSMHLLERNLLERLPGYTLIRSFAQRLAGTGETEAFAPVLVELEEALVPAFLVERHPDGRCTVFVPSAPTPAAGSIYILTPERVHRVDVPIVKAMSCISKWGNGSHELLAALTPEARTGLASDRI